MSSASRWALSAGVLALVVTGAPTIIALRFPSAPVPVPVPMAVPPSPPARLASPPIDPSLAADAFQSLPQVRWERADGPPARRADLEMSLASLLRTSPLRAGVFGVDLASGRTFAVSGDGSFAAASLIKVPIAVALLVAADRGAIDLDEKLVMRSQDIAGGSGGLQYLPVGSSFSIRRLAELMVRRSDNTATNMLIARLGGLDNTNAIFARWGLKRTALNALLPDMGGTNRTSPADLVTVLAAAIESDILTARSRGLLLAWMGRSHVRSMIPASVGPGVFVANKTGDIPGALGDAGYVIGPSGRRYLLAVQVERPRNSPRAKQLIRTVSSSVWSELTGRPSPLRAQVASRRGGGPRAASWSSKERIRRR